MQQFPFPQYFSPQQHISSHKTVWPQILAQLLAQKPSDACSLTDSTVTRTKGFSSSRIGCVSVKTCRTSWSKPRHKVARDCLPCNHCDCSRTSKAVIDSLATLEPDWWHIWERMWQSWDNRFDKGQMRSMQRNDATRLTIWRWDVRSLYRIDYLSRLSEIHGDLWFFSKIVMSLLLVLLATTSSQAWYCPFIRRLSAILQLQLQQNLPFASDNAGASMTTEITVWSHHMPTIRIVLIRKYSKAGIVTESECKVQDPVYLGHWKLRLPPYFENVK